MTYNTERFISFFRLLLLGLVLVILVAQYLRKHEIRRIPDNILHIAYLPTEMADSRISPYGPGFERELIALFCARFSLTPNWIAIDAPQQGWRMLNRNEADILIGAGAWLKPIRTLGRIDTGPLYNIGPPLVVRNWKEAVRRPSTLSCTDPMTLPVGSFLFDLRQEIELGSDCSPPIRPQKVPSLPPLLTNLEKNRTGSALLGAPLTTLWLPFFPKIRSYPPDQDLTYGSRWYWSTGNGSKAAKLRHFWKNIQTSSVLRDLQDRYLEFIPDQIDYYELRHFSRTLRKKLPRYAAVIKAEADDLGLDPLLLVAMIYQESRFDRDAESRTGVRGLLQLTQATAEEMGIQDRLDPYQSIRGGARYLKKILNQIDPRAPRFWDKIFLALASYNQGLGHTLDAMRLTDSRGLDGLTWKDVKTVYPLLAYKKYHSQTKFGYCRGYEAVDYVKRIRYYYYLLHGFIALGRPETKYLAPVLLAENTTHP